VANLFTNESNFHNNSRKGAKLAKKNPLRSLRLGEKQGFFSCLISLRPGLVRHHVRNNVKKRFYLTCMLILLLNGCGFHLRNAQPVPEYLNPLYIKGLERYEQLNRTLRDTFLAADVRLASDQALAASILTVKDHGQSRQVITVDSRGKATEYALTRKLTVKLTDADGKVLMDERTVGVERDWIDVGKDGLAGRVEESQLQQDMHRDLALSILRVLGYALK
jgi:LPS-assembly lipoprotein